MTEAKTPPPSRRQSVHRKGSLADVNLERPMSPFQRSRRQSKFDAADIDILGTASQYRRSVTELRSTDTFGGTGAASLNSIHVDSKHSTSGSQLSPRTTFTIDISQTRADSIVPAETTDASTNPAKEYIDQGRRPSLAELINIYESTTGDTTHGENRTIRLPVLQET